MDENEKSWFERIYGPTWRSIKDPETYKSLLDLSSYGDVIDAPGAGEGLEELYDFLGGPSRKEWKKLYEGYDDNWTKYPKMAYDAGAFGVNTVKDVLQFIPDVATDTLQYLAADKGDGWFPGLSQEQKYKLDAWAPFGLPSVYTDEQGGNPYRDPSIFNKYFTEAGNKAEKHFFTHEDKGGFMNEKKAGEMWDVVEEKLPWAKWVRENPNTDPEVFRKLEDRLFMTEFNKRYGDQWQEFVETDVDRSLMEDYGIGADKSLLFGDEGSAYEFGMFGDKKIPFTDQKIGGYAWEGEGLLPYFNKEKQTIQDAHVLSDIVGSLGLRSPLKWLAKQTSTGAPEGIMKNMDRIEEFKIPETWRKGNSRIKPDWQEGIFDTDVGRDIINRNFR